MERPVLIAPSLLSSDFSKLAEEANRMISYGADWLHMDIMDGHFVPNLTIGAPVISSLRKNTNGFIDCHLMVSEPEKWVDQFADAGANQYTFHIEATSDPIKLINMIKKRNMRVGVAIKPKTEIDEIIPLIEQELIDTVLVMTVEPGFGGQKFMSDMMPKVKELRDMYPDLNIQVDGGINNITFSEALDAGANVFVAGSYIFKAPDQRKAINILREYSKN